MWNNLICKTIKLNKWLKYIYFDKILNLNAYVSHVATSLDWCEFPF
jgi:hypothetical protein